MNLIEFIKQYADRKNGKTRVVLEWFWIGGDIDEEYCFDGSPSDFIEKYTKGYDCIDGFDIFDIYEMRIINEGMCTQIYIKIRE